MLKIEFFKTWPKRKYNSVVRILVTGHTGFKGSWLCLMLKFLGHEVYGIGLNPLKSGIFELASVGRICKSDVRLDIRNKKSLDSEINRIQPEVVLHLAAQALVLTSFEQIYDTFSTNVSGTLNILDSSLRSRNLKGILIVTTDKVYQNKTKKVFVETDSLGGKDPYSSSKALADQLTQAWSLYSSAIPIGIARAGNVIGGGDVSPNRLIPDIFAAIRDNRLPIIRNPKSVRPWQHVLDCLNGYLKLMDFIVSGNSGIFNFGPTRDNLYSVEDVARYSQKRLKVGDWTYLNNLDDTEANFLALNSQKACDILGWSNKLDFEEGLDLTLSWELAALNSENLEELTLSQIQNFINS